MVYELMVIASMMSYRGMQLGAVLSTSHVANSFMGTGLGPDRPEEVIPPEETRPPEPATVPWVGPPAALPREVGPDEPDTTPAG